MAEFIEERLPVCVRMGSTYADEYTVEITQTANKGEYRQLIQPFPMRVFNIMYTHETAQLWNEILSLYHRCYGMFAGFRVRVLDDYSTNARTGTVTHTDQPLKQISSTIYQLQVGYGTGTVLSIGKPYRYIHKPVSGTVKIGIGGALQSSGYTVDYTTGRITFSGAPGGAVTGGCEFDIPCRFNSRIDIKSMATNIRETSEIEIIELLNP